MNFMSQKLINDARDFLECLELKGCLTDEKKVLSFCCACCRLVWDNLPQIARQAVKISEKYIDKNASLRDLENARNDLWNYLEKDFSSLEKVNVSAVRAAICCLYEIKTHEDGFNSIDNVMDFCNSIEIKSFEQYKLLTEIFSES